jgi:hypothetical protein
VFLNHGRRSRMLILTRNQNESIIINDDIKITVLSDNCGKVRLGDRSAGGCRDMAGGDLHQNAK